MRIFVTTGVLLHDTSEDFHSFLNEVLRIVVNQNAEHEFIIHSNDSDASKFSAGNVTRVEMRNVFRLSLLVKMWYDLKIPAILKKYKADLFISFDGFCSMTTGIPQFIVFNDSFSLDNASVLSRPRSIFYNRFMQKSLQKAKKIICISDFRKKDLRLRYLVDTDKLDVMYPAVNGTFQTLNEDVKEKVRMKYSDGKNYFAFTGTMEKRQDLFNLLKAFSAFKKRQKSNWKLLLTGYPHQYDRNFLESLASYKYRTDVVVAKNVNEFDRAGLIGSAYAVICAAHSEIMVFPILQAFKCGVPLIVADTTAVREVAGNDALYYDHSDSESIASQMMTIYKDESFRSSLIEKGKEKVKKYSFDKSAKLLWEYISGTKVDFKSHGTD